MKFTAPSLGDNSAIQWEEEKEDKVEEKEDKVLLEDGIFRDSGTTNIIFQLTTNSVDSSGLVVKHTVLCLRAFTPERDAG